MWLRQAVVQAATVCLLTLCCGLDRGFSPGAPRHSKRSAITGLCSGTGTGCAAFGVVVVITSCNALHSMPLHICRQTIVLIRYGGRPIVMMTWPIPPAATVDARKGRHAAVDGHKHSSLFFDALLFLYEHKTKYRLINL